MKRRRKKRRMRKRRVRMRMKMSMRRRRRRRRLAYSDLTNINESVKHIIYITNFSPVTIGKYSRDILVHKSL